MKQDVFFRGLAGFVAAAVLLTGCSDTKFTGAIALVSAGSAASRTVPENPYPIPDFRDAVFHPDKASDYKQARFDDSAMDQGYVALQARGEKKLKLQVTSGEQKYTYDVPGNGETVVVPLNMGNGQYKFRLLENVAESRYAVLWSEERTVKLADEFQPFLRPSQLAQFRENSKCAVLARELASGCSTDSEVVAAVYDYLVDHIDYDYDKAANIKPGYLPDPDRCLSEGKGICFDYASLAAAMMRSLGIPCKLITGYVDGDLYHAWNSFYLHDQGWVTVEIRAVPGIWQRVDITMAATGRAADKLQDDNNYTTRYTY